MAKQINVSNMKEMAAQMNRSNMGATNNVVHTYGPVKVDKPAFGKVKIKCAGKTIKMSKKDYNNYARTAKMVGCDLAAILIAKGIVTVSAPVFDAATKVVSSVGHKIPGIKKLFKGKTEITNDDIDDFLEVDSDDDDDDEDWDD